MYTVLYQNQVWTLLYPNLRIYSRTNITNTTIVYPITLLSFFLVEFHPSFILSYSSYTTSYFPWFILLSLKFSFTLFLFFYFSGFSLLLFSKGTSLLLVFSISSSLFSPYFSLEFLLLSHSFPSFLDFPFFHSLHLHSVSTLLTTYFPPESFIEVFCVFPQATYVISVI